MKTHHAECTVTTRSPLDFVDITGEVQACLEGSGIAHGQVTVFSPHAYCALVVNELESGLLEDIRGAVDRLGASRPQDCRTMIGSTSVVLPAVDGKLQLGMWQRVLLVELDSGCTRSVVVQITGE